MRNADFADNTNDMTDAPFNRLCHQYNITKLSPKDLRQDYVRACLDTAVKVDIGKLSLSEQEKALDISVQLSTWAKRGALRQRALNQVKSLYTQTTDIPYLNTRKNTHAEMLIQSNKPTHVAFFVEHLQDNAAKSLSPMISKP